MSAVTADQTFRVGRLTIPGVGLSRVASMSASGSSLRIVGRVANDDPNVNAAVRQVLTGMIDDPDEPVVAVTYGPDPSVDGYYRIASGSIEAGAGSLAIGWWSFELELDAGPNRGAWLWSAVVQGGLRTNYVGFTAANCTPWYAVPNDSRNFLWIDGNTDTYAGLTVDGGTLAKRRHGSTFDGYASWEGTPASHYVGAALLEWRPKGLAGWFPVVGRRCPSTMAAWRIGNGLVRLTYEGGPFLLFEVYRGATFGWEGRTFTIAGAPTLAGVSIMRNDPSEVRVDCSVTDTAVGSRWVTFVARRGDTWLRGSTRATTISAWSISQASPETWTTNGYYAQSPAMTTGSAARWLAISTYPYSIHANGGITSTYGNLGSAWTFGVSQSGVAVSGDFFTAQSDRLQAIRR